MTAVMIILMILFVRWLYWNVFYIPEGLYGQENFYDDNDRTNNNTPAVSPDEKILQNEVEKFLNDKDEIELREKLDEIKKEV